MKQTCFCPLPDRSCSRVAHSRSLCYPAINRRTCTYRTSYERFCICHSVARWANICPVPITERYRMCSWAHWSENRIWCVWTYPEWQTRWRMVSPLSSHVYSTWYRWDYQKTWWFLRSSHNMLLDDSLAFILWGCKLHFHSFQSCLRELANNLRRFFSTMVLDLACFPLNMFTYSKMNGICLNWMMSWMCMTNYPC